MKHQDAENQIRDAKTNLEIALRGDKPETEVVVKTSKRDMKSGGHSPIRIKLKSRLSSELRQSTLGVEPEATSPVKSQSKPTRRPTQKSLVDTEQRRA